MITMFSYKKINSKPPEIIEVVRGLSIFLMILYYVVHFYGDQIFLGSVIGKIISFLISLPVGPVFTYILGIYILFDYGRDARTLAFRGVFILIMGYVLNALAGFLPHYLMYMANSDPLSLEAAFQGLIRVDLLQFIGLTYLFFALVIKLRFNHAFILIIAIMLSGITFFLDNISVNNYLLQGITSLFWGSYKVAFYPFLTWIFYPVAGYLFADLMSKCRNLHVFFIQCLGISVVFLVLGILLFYGVMRYDIGIETKWGYYHHNLVANLLYTAFVIMWTSLIYTIKKFIPNLVKDTLKRYSRNFTVMFIVQVFLVTWGQLLFRTTFNVWQIFLGFIVVLAVSDFVASAFHHYTNNDLI